jgi:signal transduction histidine kinase
VTDSEPIPDYALPRLPERFYPLPRPRTGRKSKGIGLSFVQEVTLLHGGSFLAELTLPAEAGPMGTPSDPALSS